MTAQPTPATVLDDEVCPSLATILDRLADDEGQPVGGVATTLLHDIVARVKKTGATGKVTINLVVDTTKGGVTIAGAVVGKVTATIGTAKGNGDFSSKRFGQLFPEPEDEGTLRLHEDGDA